MLYVTNEERTQLSHMKKATWLARHGRKIGNPLGLWDVSAASATARRGWKDARNNH